MIHRILASKQTKRGMWIAVFVAVCVAGLGAAPAPQAAPGLKIERSKVTGLATFVTAGGGGAIAVQPAVAGGRIQPMDFLTAQGHLFGVRDAARELVQTRAEADQLGQTHTSYQQLHKGVPVFSGVLKVHQAGDGSILAANGDFYPIPDRLDTNPQLTGDAAAALALAVLGRGQPNVEHSELVIVDPGWYGDPPMGAHLAYYIILSDMTVPMREAFFVDAHRGRILDQWNLLETSRSRQVFNDVTQTLVRSEGGPPTGDFDADSAYDYSGDWYDYIFRAFGRDSYDGSGGTLSATVHLVSPQCPNAFGGGGWTWFCDGIASDDVVAHEWGHSLTGWTSNLIYQNQAGQLNESYSDVWGELVDLFNGNAGFVGTPGGTSWPTDATYGGPGTDTPNLRRRFCNEASVRWLVGEDSTGFGGAIRDMWDPTCFGDPDRANSPLQTCDGSDNGGVHSGSGIPNHAFAMLVDGKTFNGYTVSAIGPIKAGAVWYRAGAVYLTPASIFMDAYTALNQAAADLINTNVVDPRDGVSTVLFTAADADEVGKALRAVEMNTEGSCGAWLNVLDSTPPIKCPDRSVVHSDDFESGVGGWTVFNSGPAGPPTPYNWSQVSGGLPYGWPGTVWYVQDLNSNCGINQSAVHSLTSPVISLPTYVRSPTLAFTHYVDVETSWDGGNIKIGVNGGPFQLIPKSAFLYNKYNDRLISAAQGNTNPMAGQDAWTGVSMGGGNWGTSLIDLSNFVSGGENVQFRFDFGKDGCVGRLGWYVDDFEIYHCPSWIPPTLTPDPTDIKKSRFISFSVPSPATATVDETALRVKLTSLHHVDPPYAGVTIPFTLFEGQSQYVGKPKAYVESSSPGIRFAASQLQCTPYYRDWTSLNSCSAAAQFCDVAADCKRCTNGTGTQACNVDGDCIGIGGNNLPCANNPADTCSVPLPGLLAVTGEAIVPSSEYEVSNLGSTCAGNEETCTAVSAALTITTGRWGDVVIPFQLSCAEQGIVACPVCNANCIKQPDFDDISALVNKFKSATGAPIKARGLLAGETGARGLINMEPDLGFSHISADVDAFKKLAYPYKPGRCAGNAAKACISDADCTNPTTGPCVLECAVGPGRPCVCP